MLKIKLALAALLVAVISACTTVAPLSTPVISVPATPLPGSSVAPSAAAPTVAPSAATATTAPASVSPTAEPPTEAPATPAPTRTPKPTKKPTPTPSPTPAKIPGDIEVGFEASTIPSPFYNNTDYTIRVYISALGTQNLPNVHAKLVVQNEGFSYEFDTGPIAVTDSYYKDVVVNVPAIGPSALILTASMPDGYVDTNKANNAKTVAVEVSLAP